MPTGQACGRFDFSHMKIAPFSFTGFFFFKVKKETQAAAGGIGRVSS